MNTKLWIVIAKGIEAKNASDNAILASLAIAETQRLLNVATENNTKRKEVLDTANAELEIAQAELEQAILQAADSLLRKD